MMKDKLVAEKVSKLMLEYGEKLNASVVLVQKRCESFEFEEYRSAIGNLMGCMLLDLMNPIYLQHPELKPEQLE